MVRIDDWADPSLAERREARRFGIAIAAIIPMIATTTRSSIKEKPDWRLQFISYLRSLSFEESFAPLGTVRQHSAHTTRSPLNSNYKGRATKELCGLSLSLIHISEPT